MEQAIINGTWIQKKEYGRYIGGEFDTNTELISTESKSLFLEIRNLLMLTIVPKRLTIKDNLQSAYLKAAVSRVNKNNIEIYFFILFSRFVT